MNIPETILAALALLGGIASVVSTISLLLYRTAHVTTLEKELRRDLKEALEKLANLLTLVEVFSKEQAVINKFQATMHEKLEIRVDWLEQVSLRIQRKVGITE